MHRRIWAALGLLLVSPHPAFAQSDKDADGLYAAPTCLARMKEFQTERGRQPTGEKGRHPQYALEIYASPEGRWALVGERSDGSQCALGSGRSYPDGVRTEFWYAKYFGGPTHTLATGPIDFAPYAYLSFAGLKHGDDEARMRQLLGEPREVSTSGGDVTHRYGDGAIRVRTLSATKRITSVHVDGVKGVLFLKSRGVADRKLDFVGRQRGDFRAAWGTPDLGTASTLEYSSQSGPRKVQVNLECGGGNACLEVSVYWYD